MTAILSRMECVCVVCVCVCVCGGGGGGGGGGGVNFVYGSVMCMQCDAILESIRHDTCFMNS